MIIWLKKFVYKTQKLFSLFYFLNSICLSSVGPEHKSNSRRILTNLIKWASSSSSCIEYECVKFGKSTVKL